MSRITLDRPQSLGFIDPSALEKLQREFPAAFGEKYSYDESGSADEKFLDIVAPVTQAISRYVLSKTGNLPEDIKYSFSTNPAQPRKSQRGFNKWHTDAHDREILLVSSALTTNVLISRERPIVSKLTHGLLRASTAAGMFEQELITAAIAAGAVEVYNPEPYEMVITTNSLHRPAINTTGSDVPRVFLRAMASMKD